MEAAYKRFMRVWLLATLVAVAVIVALNILVDPAGAYPRLHLAAFEPFRYTDLDRITKAEMLSRGDWEVIILGSSRAETGLPADHPSMVTNRTCNVSLAAARFPELVAVFDFAQQHNHLKKVILCADLYMFAPGAPWISDFAESRFNPAFNRFQYYCKQFLGRASFNSTWATLREWVRGRRPVPQETRGFHSHALGANTSQRELFNRVLRILGAGYRTQSVDPAYLEQFRHIVQVCRDRGIDLQVVIMPVHALDIELLYAGGRWAEFEKWKTDLLNVLVAEGVEDKFNLWDFTGYAGPPAETIPPEGDVTTRMKYYYENSHCTPVLGGRVLDEVFGGTGTNAFGVKLDRANLQAHLARIKEDRSAYARTNAAEIQWVQRIMSEVSAPRH